MPAHTYLDLTGQRFGRLIVISEAARRGTNEYRRYWLCACDCGTVRAIVQGALRSKATTSCGCRNPEALIASRTTHGHSKRGQRSPEYKCWKGMRTRCRNPKDPGYLKYGARGIRICERWDDFGNFLADMGPKPTPEHSIDRIDHNGNYEPGNCRWATLAVQANNKRSNHLIEHDGLTLTVPQWAKRTGVDACTIHRRIANGWTEADAVSQPGYGARR